MVLCSYFEDTMFLCKLFIQFYPHQPKDHITITSNKRQTTMPNQTTIMPELNEFNVNHTCFEGKNGIENKIIIFLTCWHNDRHYTYFFYILKSCHQINICIFEQILNHYVNNSDIWTIPKTWTLNYAVVVT